MFLILTNNGESIMERKILFTVIAKMIMLITFSY